MRLGGCLEPENSRAAIFALILVLVVSGCTFPGSGSVTGADRAHTIDVVMPANAPGIKADFGTRYRVDGECCREQPNDGIDIVAGRGHAVIAPADGTVSFVGEDFSLGKQLALLHTLPNGSRITSRYLHLDGIDVKARQNVYRGQRIGRVGRTGSGSGGVYHLHFSVSLGNPHYYWIGGRGIVECFDPEKIYQPSGDAIFTYPVACLED